MSQALAVTLWFAAIVMLVVVPIEHRRLAGWGEGATAVRATVLEHGQGVSRPWPPGSYWTSVKVEWMGADGALHQKWLYDLDPDIPAVGSMVTLVHPADRPDALGRHISAAQRWQTSLRFVAWSLLVAALGAMIWFGTQGPSWVRFSPRWVLCAGLFVLGLSTVSVTAWDRFAHLYRFQEIEGAVIATIPGARRRIGGTTVATWDVVVRYPAQGADYETIWRGVPSPPPVGAPLLVRYDPARPDFGVLEAPRLHLWGIGIGGVMALLGLGGLVWVSVSWYRAD